MSHPTHLRIVSGGQTGVDRAALDAARAAGVATGGWCPRGGWAEDGPIPAGYGLVETPSTESAERTRLNVRDSDATLVLISAPQTGGPQTGGPQTGGPQTGRPQTGRPQTGDLLAGGTLLTAETARVLRRPLLVVNLDTDPDPGAAVDWLHANGARTLNVAGPRASEARGVYEQARAFVAALLERL